MSIETDFRATLAAHAPLVALVATRIALNAVPEGQAVPLVVYDCTHDRTLGLDNSLLADQATLQVQCWAATATQADEVADAVLAAVATAPAASGACVLSRASTHDPELGLDGVTLTVEWWA
jgi:hypothetical protein